MDAPHPAGASQQNGSIEEYPLTPATAQAIQRYVQEARPQGFGPELFLTLHAPFRRLSSGALYGVVRSSLEELALGLRNGFKMPGPATHREGNQSSDRVGLPILWGEVCPSQEHRAPA